MAILHILAQRSLVASSEIKARLSAASEPELRMWHARAVSAADIKDVFDES